MHVSEALASRRSVRAFTDDAVDKETIKQILEVASRAPSGTNCQPWWVYAVTGPVKDAISDEVIAIRESGEPPPPPEYTYSPPNIGEPYLSRRRKVGWDLYGLLDKPLFYIKTFGSFMQWQTNTVNSIL